MPEDQILFRVEAVQARPAVARRLQEQVSVTGSAQVTPTDAGGLDLDQYLTVTGLGIRDLVDDERAGPVHRCKHVALLHGSHCFHAEYDQSILAVNQINLFIGSPGHGVAGKPLAETSLRVGRRLTRPEPRASLDARHSRPLRA